MNSNARQELRSRQLTNLDTTYTLFYLMALIFNKKLYKYKLNMSIIKIEEIFQCFILV